MSSEVLGGTKTLRSGIEDDGALLIEQYMSCESHHSIVTILAGVIQLLHSIHASLAGTGPVGHLPTKALRGIFKRSGLVLHP